MVIQISDASPWTAAAYCALAFVAVQVLILVLVTIWWAIFQARERARVRREADFLAARCQRIPITLDGREGP